MYTICIIAKRSEVVSDYQERKLSFNLTFYSLSLLLSATSLLKEYTALLVYDVHIYLQHLQAIYVCCCSTEWAVAQCACITLAVLYEEMRDFVLFTN